MKKVFALVLALAMIFALAVPAMAAETYTVTINNVNQFVPHTYEAYQIFAGDLTEKNGKDVLSNVTWGTGVTYLNAENQDVLLEAVKDSHTAFAEAKTVEDIAKVLSDNSTVEAVVNKFRSTVAANLSETYYKATRNDTAYTFSGLEAGYYLIKDKDNSLDGKADTYTNIILEVVGNSTIVAKDGGVTVDKNINDGGTLKEVADYSIGDTVSFEITGTLPSNYQHFDKFGYKILDTMDPELTYTPDTIKVYAENAGTKTQLTENTSYTLAIATDSDGCTSIDILFKDLKTITEATIDQHTSFFVTYDAVINRKAEAGQFDKNSVLIQFNNHPHTEEWGETVKDEVWVITWELDVTKIDGTNNTKLTGAEFVLYRGTGDNKEYVMVTDGKVTGFTKDSSKATTLVSGTDGKFVVEGLEADVYYLQETKAPTGYNLNEEPTLVDITATGGLDSTGKPATNSLTIKVGLGQPKPGNTETGIVDMDFINNPGATLPETGGVGTTMFYIFGGLMFVGAAVLLVTKKRMAC